MNDRLGKEATPGALTGQRRPLNGRRPGCRMSAVESEFPLWKLKLKLSTALAETHALKAS